MQDAIESLTRRLAMKDDKHKGEIAELHKLDKLNKEYEEKFVEQLKKYGELTLQHSELSVQHNQLSADFDSLEKQHLEVEKLQTEAANSLNAKSRQLEELQNELAVAQAQVSWLYTLTLDSCGYCIHAYT